MNTYIDDSLGSVVTFTSEQVNLAYHVGDCEAGSSEVANEVKDQFKNVKDRELCDFLSEFGIDRDELGQKDRKELIMYAVWVMCGNIAESEEYKTHG